VTRLLARTLVRLESLEFNGLGDMGPVTHPEIVNVAIEDSLRHTVAA
jgi:hypothetical protein